MAPENGWLEYYFLLGPGLFSAAKMLVLGSVTWEFHQSSCFLLWKKTSQKKMSTPNQPVRTATPKKLSLKLASVDRVVVGHVEVAHVAHALWHVK